MFLTGGTWYWGVLDTYSVKRKDVEPFPYPRFADGKDIGGVGYGYCLYVSKLAKDPDARVQVPGRLASQPNEFIKQGYHQPRVTLSNGKPALDPTLAKKYIPFYDEVFKGELAKTAVWLSSTKGNQVTTAVWDAISRVIYQGVSVDDSVTHDAGRHQGDLPVGTSVILRPRLPAGTRFSGAEEHAQGKLFGRRVCRTTATCSSCRRSSFSSSSSSIP